jgi:hypothetical protein
VPNISLQDEVIESDLISSKVTEMTAAAETLRNLSSDKDVVHLAEKVMHETELFQKFVKKRVNICSFLPMQKTPVCDK